LAAEVIGMRTLQEREILPLVAIARTQPRTQPHRPYDFRPPPDPKPERQICEPWRIEMKAKLETDNAKALYKRRKQTVEPFFGIVKSAMRFRNVLLWGLDNVKTEWTLVSLAYNCRRMVPLKAT